MGARLRLLCFLKFTQGWRVGDEGLVFVFVVGLGVGVLYGLIRLKSPAPPIVALLGLSGMVLGEQLGGWILAKKVNVIRHLRLGEY